MRGPGIASSQAFREFLPLECLFAEGSAEDLAEKLEYLINLPQEAKQAYGKRFRQYIIERHDLTLLTKELARTLYLRGAAIKASRRCRP